MKIDSITLSNFKGCKQATYNFNGHNVSIEGKNGIGKTTIATAYMWVFADKDYDLHSNPYIRPLGVEEATPRVDIVLDINGKKIYVAKMQKRTVKKSKTGGADAISLSNAYEINSIEYGERDFKKKLEEYGFNFDLFLPLSHPNVFTSQKAAEMRKVLFNMATEKTDLEIAEMTKDVNEAKALLGTYSFDEVKAMQNATIRKIKEVYGKDGEILRAKIEGMEQSKSNIAVDDLELQKQALIQQIEETDKKKEDVSAQYEERKKLLIEINELKSQLDDLQFNANVENNKKRKELENQVFDVKTGIELTERKNKTDEMRMATMQQLVNDISSQINSFRAKWKQTNEMQFDENSCICSYCGQEYPADKKEKLKADFMKNKVDDLKRITEKGTELSNELKLRNKELEEFKTEIESRKPKLDSLKETLSKLNEKLSLIPSGVDVSGTKEYKAIKSQLDGKTKALDTYKTVEDTQTHLNSLGSDLQRCLIEVEKKITIANKNNEIDKAIADLKAKQIEYEQNKANAEKVLYQLELISQKKNEILTDEINKNFSLVKWKMFDYQKNGEYKECCIPQFNGKDMNVSTNTGLEIMMKLDIINGLQRFYKTSYPAFLDGAESLSSDTKELIKTDFQSIYLSVAENNEINLKIEGE